jgi:hypothetical protein
MPTNVKLDDKGRADVAKQDEKPTAKPTAKPAVDPASIVAAAPPPAKSVGIQEPVDPDANKTIAQLAADKAAYMGPNKGNQDARAQLMAERANAADEARRVSALRMAEFFGAWGSTPGNTIVAGLNTLKNKVPDLISDMKEETKIRRQINKDIAEIEKIERLEKEGNYDEAAKRKAELGKNALTKYGYDIKAYSDAQQTAGMIKAAGIRASYSGGGSGGEDRALNNLIGKRTEIQKAITTKTDKLGSIVRIANRQDNKDPEVQAKIVDARNKVKEATSGLQAELAQINGLINTYQKVQGLDTPTPGKVIEYDAKGNRI